MKNTSASCWQKLRSHFPNKWSSCKNIPMKTNWMCSCAERFQMANPYDTYCMHNDIYAEFTISFVPVKTSLCCVTCYIHSALFFYFLGDFAYRSDSLHTRQCLERGQFTMSHSNSSEWVFMIFYLLWVNRCFMLHCCLWNWCWNFISSDSGDSKWFSTFKTDIGITMMTWKWC